MGKILERAPGIPFVYNRLRARDEVGNLLASKDSRTDTSISESSLNGQITHNTDINKTDEKPERFTRSSGIRPMHQSGWSFSGMKVRI